LSQQLAAIKEQGSTRIGEPDGTRRPLEEEDVQVGFEFAELLTQRRLCDSELLSSAAEMKFLGKSDEVKQPAKVESRWRHWA
jgi:hypothetical protein